MNPIQDEEEAANAAAVMPPPGEAPPDAPLMDEGEAGPPVDPQAAETEEPAAEGQPASPKQQKIFEVMVTQAFKLVTSDDGIEALVSAVKAKGAEEAVASVVSQVLLGSEQAAEKSGVDIPEDVLLAAAQPLVAVLLATLERSGFVKDPEAAASQTMALAQQLMRQGEGAEPNEGDESGGQIPPPGGAQPPME